MQKLLKEEKKYNDNHKNNNSLSIIWFGEIFFLFI